MRKVLSIVLALAMVLGCFASVFAATYPDVKATDDFATAVSVLSDLGVVNGYTDGTYKPEKVVNRAEMASLIVNALGMTPAASATTNFSDVPATHWASGYIAYANSLGIIAGYTDGTFKPSKDVSYDEAITMIINALGYTADGLTGTWPTAFVMKAQDLGVLDDVTVLGSTGANRGDVAHMLYNTLPVKFVKYSKLLEDFTESTATKNTMYKRLGAKVDETATDITPELIKAETTVADLSDLLGAKAVLVKSTDGKKVLAVDSVETEFVEGKYDATKKTVGTFSIDGYDGTNVIVYKNGAKISTPASLDGVTFKAAVDTAAKKIASVQYWEKNGDVQVTADIKADATMIEDVKLPVTEKKLDTTKFELVGAGTIADIKKGDVVTYYYAGDTTNVVKVEVCNTVVTGKVTKIASDNKTITMDGKQYKLPATVSFVKADYDKTWDVFYNYSGDIVAFAEHVDEAGQSDTFYGVVLATNYETAGDGWTDSTTTATRQVKLVDVNGETQIYTVNKDAKDDLLAKDTNGKFATTIEKGTVVEYTLNDDGELSTMAEFTLSTPEELTVKNSMINGKAFASDLIVFSCDNDDATATKATITAAATLADGKYKNLAYKLNTKGQIGWIFVGPAADATPEKTYGIYTGYASVKDGYEVKFIVNGVETSYTATEITGLEVNGKLVVISVADTKYTNPVADVEEARVKGFTVATKSAVNGTTYIADEKAEDSVVIAADARYFVYDSAKKTVTESDQAAMLKSKKVTFYDTTTKADSIYDVVIFEKPAE